MYTPREATEKECRLVHTTNVDLFNLNVTKCETHYCMHWRWSKWRSVLLYIIGPLYIQKKGYCGLSGRP